MKTIVAASVIALMSSSVAMAGGPRNPGSHTPPPVEVVDIQQAFQGIQAALNKIEGGDEVDTIVQEAMNAANLINLESDTLDVVSQVGSGLQIAANYVDFSKDIEDVTQEATNVLNSITVSSVTGSISQTTSAGQAALNSVQGVGYSLGSVGRGGMGHSSSDDITDVTQTALNAANLLSLGEVGDDLEIDQVFTTGQLAANYVGALDAVSEVTQTATNVANSIGNISTGE